MAGGQDVKAVASAASSGTAEGAVKGAVANGQNVKEVTSAASAGTTEGAVKGAAVGGAAGGISGRTAGAMQDSNDAGFVVRKCLTGRGWTVLDYDGQK